MLQEPQRLALDFGPSKPKAAKLTFDRRGFIFGQMEPGTINQWENADCAKSLRFRIGMVDASQLATSVSAKPFHPVVPHIGPLNT